MLGGIAAVPRPRPGWLIVSLSLVTGEFEPIARLINWLEVRLRRLALGPRRLGEIAIVMKVLVILTILPCFAALGYGTYYLLFGG